MNLKSPEYSHTWPTPSWSLYKTSCRRRWPRWAGISKMVTHTRVFEDKLRNISGTTLAIATGSMIAWSMHEGAPFSTDLPKKEIPTVCGKIMNILENIHGRAWHLSDDCTKGPIIIAGSVEHENQKWSPRCKSFVKMDDYLGDQTSSWDSIDDTMVYGWWGTFEERVAQKGNSHSLRENHD